MAAPPTPPANPTRLPAAKQTLARLNLFADLAPFHPTLTGTIPLNIDIPGSDLDIICEARDLSAFAGRLAALYGHRPGFALAHQQANGLPVVVCRFQADDFPIEIFGQPRPVQAQNAWRHLLAEGRLLAMGGPAARQRIRQLKALGLKTEPAFAEYFALPGNPYETLYRLAAAPDADLRTLVLRGRQAQQNCIFCRITAGHAPAGIVYQDEATLAFMNLRQANAGHVLVIPRRHVETIFELDADLAAGLMQTVVKVARAVRASTGAPGLNVWQSNGEAACQEVLHAHFHLFPRYANDGHFKIYDHLPPLAPRSTLAALAAQIRRAVVDEL